MTSILVIEDENNIREEIIEILSFENYEAFGTENGKIGLELAEKKNPDLILCDIMMSEMDGYEILRKLRSNPKTITIPFIFLTAKTDRRNMRKGMELGADDYLTKPFTIDELLGAVQTRVEKHNIAKKKNKESLEMLRDNIIHALPHELITPLNSILGFSQFIENENDSMTNEEITHSAKQIYKAGERLHYLIQNYLFYTQLVLLKYDKKGRDKLKQHVTFDPQETIIRIAQAKAQKYGRKEDLRLKLSNCPIVIEEINFHKLINELLDNAFKFSNHRDYVCITITIEDKYLNFSIINQGRGMTQAQIDLIGAYMQFGRKIYEQQGTGFGLIISKLLIEMHGGEMQIESIPKQKTNISFTLERY